MNTDELREQIAEALLRTVIGNTDGGLVLDGDLPAGEVARLLADEAPAAVLPVVTAWAEHHARQRAADVLREAAADWSDRRKSASYANDECAEYLRDRADALTAKDPA